MTFLDQLLYLLERHYDFFRPIAVSNTILDSNANMKESIGNYECSYYPGACLIPVVYQIMMVKENQI